jgi:hypothetical protein
MKRRWIVSGGARGPVTRLVVAGVVGIAGVAMAAPPFTFTTVANVGDTVDIGGDTLLGVGQIAVNNQGDVGISGAIFNVNGEDPAVLYSTPGLLNYSTSVALDGQNYTIAGFTPSQQSSGGNEFSEFADIGISGTSLDPVLTFYGELQDATSDQGVLQYDTLSGNTSDVAFQNDTAGYQQVADDSSGNFQYQVNTSSNVLFPAVTKSSQNVIQYGRSTPAPTTVFTSPTAGVTQNIDDDYRMGEGADGSSAAVLFSGGTAGVYLIPANPPGGSPSPISLGANYTITSNQIAQPIVGYTSGVNLNQAVVLEVHDTTTNKENVVLSVAGGTPRSIIANEFSQVSGSFPFYGQLTPNGQFAAVIPGLPNTPTDTIQYGNLAVPSTVAATIASEAPASGPIPNTALAVDPSEPSLPIISLQESADDWYPDVNSNGAVAFPALLGPQGTSAADATEAILLWQSGDTSPQLVLSSSASSTPDDSDTVNIDGEEAVVNDFVWNPLGSNNDYLKSSLSDNYLAVDVDYTFIGGPNSGDSGNAVIITALSVPEPGSIALLGIGAFGLMRRQRRA